MESTSTSMELDMKVPGKMTCKTAKGKRLGPMVLSMKESTCLARSMAWAPTPGMMDLDMKENGKKTKLKVAEPTPG